MATHFFTSAAINYLPKARVLAASIRRYHPNSVIHLVLCDVEPDWFCAADEPFDQIWNLKKLAAPEDPGWRFRHNLVELSTAVKGFALVKLLEQDDCEQAVYLDPDIVVLAPLSNLLAEFQTTSILLTPHVTEPDAERSAIEDHEISSLRHGVYNLGFLGVKNSEQGRRFAAWWRDRLQEFCYDNIPGGLFTDQRWADLVPALFPEHRVLRDAGYNVCTWNLTHRNVSGAVPDDLRVNGAPLVFYHFSGFDRGAQKLMLDKYGSAMPALYELRDWYIKRCEEAGQSRLANYPWAYGHFHDGQRILDEHRHGYRNDEKLQQQFPDPYRNFLARFDLHPGAAPKPGKYFDSEPLLPHYRIVVLAAGGDQAQLQATLDQIAKPVEVLKGDARYDDLFAEALKRFADQDMLVVRAGLRLPDFWDLRLAWSAARAADAITVSPLDRRLLDAPNILDGDLADEELDQLAYYFREVSDPEVGAFTPDCVYICSAPLRLISETSPVRRLADLQERPARFRYLHRLATHVCISGRTAVPESGSAFPLSANGRMASLDGRLRQVRDTLRTADAAICHIAKIPECTTWPMLHVSHSLGGGTDTWLHGYCSADTDHEHLVLRSFGTGENHGTELHLFRFARGRFEELKTWLLSEPIKACVPSHRRYLEILREIEAAYRPGGVIVSSLIGHSLDSLRLGLPAAVVCHDYFPFCLALNITFEETCHSCDCDRLQTCIAENPNNRAFTNIPAQEWMVMRREFAAAIRTANAVMVAPSPSVLSNYRDLAPDLQQHFTVISHGLATTGNQLKLSFDAGRKLRLVVPGSVAALKGRRLFEAMLPELQRLADITLLGGGDSIGDLALNPRLRIIKEYKREDLGDLLAELQPDLGLLLSVVPETFSYTLRELQSFGVPTLATRLGSFVDWIDDRETGFLADPTPQAMLSAIRSLHDNRMALHSVHEKLRLRTSERTFADMIADYRRVMPLKRDANRYFCGPSAPERVPQKALQLYWRTGEHFDEAHSTQAVPRGLGRQTLRLHIPRQVEDVIELRLDLGLAPGFLQLYELQLQDSESNTVWTWEAATKSWSEFVTNQILFLGKNQAEASLVLGGDDPYLILPLQQPQLFLLKNGATLMAKVSFLSLLTPEDWGHSGEALRAYADRLIRERDVEQGQLRAMSLEMARNAETTKRAEELAATAGRAYEEFAARTEQERRSFDEVREKLCQYQTEAERLRLLHRQMSSSVSWRMTAPLRLFKSLLRKNS